MKDRGEYRPIYCALLDGEDFAKLSTDARLALLVLKLALPATGIGVLPGTFEMVAERCGFFEEPMSGNPITKGFGKASERAQRCLEDLIDNGWIRVHRSVVWLVRGLDFEPSLDPHNENHRKHIQRLVAALPNCKLVDDFRDHYAEWFDAIGRASEGPSKAPAMAIPITTTTTTTTTKKRSGSAVPPKLTWLSPFIDAWKAQYRGSPQGGELAKWLRPIYDEIGEGPLLAEWRRYLAETPHQYAKAAKFAAVHGSYGEPDVKVMTDENGVDRPHRKNEAGEWVAA